VVTQSELDHLLLVTLKDLDFANRYYTHYEARRSSSNMSGFSQDLFATVLKETGLPFKWDRRERIYLSEEERDDVHAWLAIWERDSVLESSVSFRLANGASIGGPFHSLALHAAQLVHKYTLYNPPYPRLPFSSLAELQETVRLLVMLYREMRGALVAANDFRNLSTTKLKKSANDDEIAGDPHMVDEDKMKEEFYAILREMEFGRRYFEQCKTFSVPGIQIDEADVVSQLSKQSSAFTCGQRKFFTSFDLTDKVRQLPVAYSVLLQNGAIEFAISVAPRGASYGGRFSYLAQNTSNFDWAPYTDRLGNSYLWAKTKNEIKKILQFGASIHMELKRKLTKSRLTPLAKPGYINGYWE
jgi:hypothetical protein